MFEEDEGPKLWLNEINVTKSTGKREYQLHNYEKAAKYFERVLEVSDKDDLSLRILLSKCYQNLYQPKLALKNHELAHKKAPKYLPVMENEAYMLFDYIGEFEESLLKFEEGIKRVTQPPNFTLGAMKILGKYDNSEELAKDRYRPDCVEKLALKLAKENKLHKVHDIVPELIKDKRPCNPEKHSVYLGRFMKHNNYFTEKLKTYGIGYNREIKNCMKSVIDAETVAKDLLFLQTKLFVYKCKKAPLCGDRLNNQKLHFKTLKDMRDLQLSKYIDTILQLLYENKPRELKEANFMTELMIDYLERINYDTDITKHILRDIYGKLGVAQYCTFQDLEDQNEEYNHERILFLLGTHKNLNAIQIQESIMGQYDPVPEVTIYRYRIRVKKSKCTLERIYLHFEMAKAYMQLGFKKGTYYYVHARNMALKSLQLAIEYGFATWAISSLILISAIQFRLFKIPNSLLGLKKAIDFAKTLNVPDVVTFLKKLDKTIRTTEPVKASRNVRGQRRILAITTDMAKRDELRRIFQWTNKMPLSRLFRIYAGLDQKNPDAIYNNAQTAHQFTSITIGSVPPRLGIPEYLLQERVHLNDIVPEDLVKRSKLRVLKDMFTRCILLHSDGCPPVPEY